jgi:ribA/ribD-fused uncharacterized protein
MEQTAAQVRSVAELQGLGGQPRYLFFWGHRPPPGGGVGRGCLSQWWPVPFTVDGLEYPSAEHYMMAAKARLFGDEARASRIREAPHPGAAKAIGREVAGFDAGEWSRHRFDIVVAGNVAKFGQHDDLRQYLLGTGDRVLVEAAPNDRIWGIGLAADDERAASPGSWLGLNLLGFALMEARGRLGSGGQRASTR